MRFGRCGVGTIAFRRLLSSKVPSRFFVDVKIDVCICVCTFSDSSEGDFPAKRLNVTEFMLRYRYKFFVSIVKGKKYGESREKWNETNVGRTS
jgi:hypothetical protein